MLSLPLLGQAVDSVALQAQRGPFRAALEGIERGKPLDATLRQTFADHPLLPWLEYAELKRDLAKASDAKVTAFRQRYADVGFSEPLRKLWLRELAKRRDWANFQRHYRAEVDIDDDLRCQHFNAQLATVTPDAALINAIAEFWQEGVSRPPVCDAAFAVLDKRGGISDALRWQRIESAAESGNASLMRFVARGLPAAEKALAEQYAAYLDAPSKKAATWPRDARSRQIAAFGATRLAKSNPAASEQLLTDLSPLGLSVDQQGSVRNQAALWTAASYLPETARRMAAVPASAFDDRLHEWRAREAMARGAWAEALSAIKAMPDTLQADPRWRYLNARMHELTRQAAVAKPLFASLATQANYHGFLAADRAGLPYALCPQEVDAKAPQRAMVERLPALTRALELNALDRRSWAEVEWKQLLAGLDADSRRQAVDIVVEAGWKDRAVFAMANAEDQRYYTLRFPFAQRQTLRRDARKHGLDEAWVAALIRAESAWQSHARSHADARGLMQLLPSTGAATAKANGLPWNGGDTLYSPRANIALGTAYLAAMLTRHNGQPYLATAAYNAGPAPIGRWLTQRANFDVDLWVETIPYRETREYVGRIMAFSVVYDWRLNGKAVPLSARMRGLTAPRQAFVCPASTITTPVSP